MCQSFVPVGLMTHTGRVKDDLDNRLLTTFIMIKKCLIPAIALLVVAVMVAACGRSNKFSVKAQLSGLGKQNVHVIYCGAQGGVVDTWVMSDKDFISIEGECAAPSLLIIYNSMNVPILRVVVESGDKIEARGNILTPGEIEVRGSDVNEEWSQFRIKNKTAYQSTDKRALNTAIEDYVKKNPASMASTVLVLVDYSPTQAAAVDRLLGGIKDEAKPKSLTMSYDALKLKQRKAVTTLSTLNLIDSGSDDFETVQIFGSKPWVILFWDKSTDTQLRRNAIEEMRMLDGAAVNCLDVNIDPDSVGWHRTLLNDNTGWRHLWVPGSVMNSEIVKLQILETPTVIVTDSTGRQLYRGDDAVRARQTVESM